MSVSSTSLENHTAIVFGGTAGIGFACAKAFAEAGANQIMLVGRNAERGQKAVSDLKAATPNVEVEFTAADACTVEGAKGAVAACIDRFGQIDILLSSAGGHPIPSIFSDQDIEGIEGILRGSLLSAMLPAHAVLPHMMDRQKGVILTIASDAGKVATPGEVVIGSAMSGLIMFSRALANEVKRSQIRVNCLSPSIVQSTEFYDILMSDPFASRLFNKAERMASLGVVVPDDLGPMAAFLASPAASKISGQVVSVNGGISMA